MISHPATRRLLAAARVETRRDHLASNDDAKRIFGVAHARDETPRRVFLRLEEVRHEPRRPRAVVRLFQRAKRGDVRRRRLSRFRVGFVGEAESSRGAESVERARVDSDAGRRDDHLGIVGDARERRGERVREEGARTEGERHARFARLFGRRSVGDEDVEVPALEEVGAREGGPSGGGREGGDDGAASRGGDEDVARAESGVVEVRGVARAVEGGEEGASGRLHRASEEKGASRAGQRLAARAKALGGGGLARVAVDAGDVTTRGGATLAPIAESARGDRERVHEEARGGTSREGFDAGGALAALALDGRVKLRVAVAVPPSTRIVVAAVGVDARRRPRRHRAPRAGDCRVAWRDSRTTTRSGDADCDSSYNRESRGDIVAERHALGDASGMVRGR